MFRQSQLPKHYRIITETFSFIFSSFFVKTPPRLPLSGEESDPLPDKGGLGVGLSTMAERAREENYIIIFALSKLSTIDELFYGKMEYIIKLKLSTFK